MSPDPPPPTAAPDGPPPPRATGLRRWLYIATGLLFTGLGFAGVFLPVLPTTPFLLIASWAFLRSDPRLHAWLRRLPGCGPLIQEWEEHGTVSRAAKWTALAFIVIAIAFSIAIGRLGRPLIALVCVLGAIGLTVVWRLPVTRVADLRQKPSRRDSTS